MNFHKPKTIIEYERISIYWNDKNRKPMDQQLLEQ